MLRRILLGTLPLLPLPALAHPNHAPTPAQVAGVIEEVKAFREKLAKAVTDKDFATLRACYADSFTHTHGSGKVDDKNARLVSAMAGEPMIENAPASELAFRVFGGPTVILTGKSPIRNVKEQRIYDFRWLCVYVAEHAGCQLAVSQATRLPLAT